MSFRKQQLQIAKDTLLSKISQVNNSISILSILFDNNISLGLIQTIPFSTKYIGVQKYLKNNKQIKSLKEVLDILVQEVNQLRSRVESNTSYDKKFSNSILSLPDVDSKYPKNSLLYYNAVNGLITYKDMFSIGLAHPSTSFFELDEGPGYVAGNFLYQSNRTLTSASEQAVLGGTSFFQTNGILSATNFNLALYNTFYVYVAGSQVEVEIPETTAAINKTIHIYRTDTSNTDLIITGDSLQETPYRDHIIISDTTLYYCRASYQNGRSPYSNNAGFGWEIELK